MFGWSDWFSFAISFLSLGSLYAVMALGLVIVYGILRLVNFAYGEYVMVAGYTLYLMNGTALPWLIMAVLAVIMAAVASYLTERVAFRPVRHNSAMAMLITSFAVSTLLQNAALLFISPRARVVPLPGLFYRSIEIAGTVIQVRDLLAIAVSLLLLAVLTVLMKKTFLGIALRAAADNFTMARLLGVPANVMIGTAFAISGTLAGVVGLFWLGRIGSVTPTIGLEPLIVAFVASVLGGVESLVGAVVGGYVLALITVAINTFLPQGAVDYREAFVFAIVILVLLVRPQGLVGQPAEVR